MGLTWNVKEVDYKGGHGMYMRDECITWLFGYVWYVVNT